MAFSEVYRRKVSVLLSAYALDIMTQELYIAQHTLLGLQTQNILVKQLGKNCINTCELKQKANMLKQ